MTDKYEAMTIARVKDIGQMFLDELAKKSGWSPDFSGSPSPRNWQMSSREFSIAATKIEEAVMWAMRGFDE